MCRFSELGAGTVTLIVTQRVRSFPSSSGQPFGSSLYPCPETLSSKVYLSRRPSSQVILRSLSCPSNLSSVIKCERCWGHRAQSTAGNILKCAPEEEPHHCPATTQTHTHVHTHTISLFSSFMGKCEVSFASKEKLV